MEDLNEKKVKYAKVFIKRIMLSKGLLRPEKKSESAVFTDLEYVIATFLLYAVLHTKKSFKTPLNFRNQKDFAEKFSEVCSIEDIPDPTVIGSTLKKLVAHGLITKEKEFKESSPSRGSFLRIYFRLEVIDEKDREIINTLPTTDQNMP